jgi:hypothetical protein
MNFRDSAHTADYQLKKKTVKTGSLEQNVYWEAGSRSAGQAFTVCHETRYFIIRFTRARNWLYTGPLQHNLHRRVVFL